MLSDESEGAWEQASAGDALRFFPAPVFPRSHALTLILGLGNPLLGDDGVGWRVAQECAKNLAALNADASQIEIDCHAGGGLSLMERLVGYDRAILIDALTTGAEPTGTVYSFPLEELGNPAVGHLMSSHDTTLQNALDAGCAMHVDLPKRVVVVAIEAERVYDFAEGLSPRVAEAVPRAARMVEDLLCAWNTTKDKRGLAPKEF